MVTEYLFSGTLGDAYVALCKLQSVARLEPCRLRRMCRNPGTDAMISSVAALFPGVSYDPDYIHFDVIADMRQFAFSNADRYINIFWDGDGRGNEPDDPPDIAFVAFPDLLPLELLSPLPPAMVGIQLKSGSRSEGQRWLDPQWVIELSELLGRAGCTVSLLGIPDGYSEDEFNSLGNIQNCVHQSYKDGNVASWLYYLGSVNFLVTPEGFSSFFALSRGVPSLVVFENADAILRMAREWRELAICVRPQTRQSVLGGARWRPLPAAQVASIILARVNPDFA